MWITTDSGKLLNLDCAEQIVAVGETVTAMLPGEQNIVSIVRASKGSPDEYLQRIAAAIDSGVGHRDVRNLSRFTSGPPRP